MARIWTLEWEVTEMTLPSASFASLATQNGRQVLAFDSAADEIAIMEGILPAEYAGGTLTLRLSVMANATTGVARMEAVDEMRTPNANESGNSDSYGSVNTASITSDTAYEVASLDITMSSHGATPAAGDRFRIKLNRDGDGSGGTDSLAVDLLLMGAEFFEGS